ncbi:hypothetical protein EVAR_53056_1 [Eumeta japonica]|uniref:Uncharacterized protein n=1 Tax=Eumeta variegata TaxID=151549 RepID=A0A4C1YVD1_EUMVA|nr:hypothetical protein EVAR_53056_1 [Eumeta japonica]
MIHRSGDAARSTRTTPAQRARRDPGPFAAKGRDTKINAKSSAPPRTPPRFSDRFVSNKIVFTSAGEQSAYRNFIGIRLQKRRVARRARAAARSRTNYV